MNTSKENPHNQTAGYGLGCEFKYYFYNRLYALANFHAGIYNEFTPRTAMAEVGEVDFSMHWRTQRIQRWSRNGNRFTKDTET